MSYVNCPDCNQKALSVATRCPRCGLAFEGRFAGPPVKRSRPIVPILLLTGGLAGVLVAVNLVVRETGTAPKVGVPVAKAPVVKAPAVSEGMVPPPRPEPARQPAVAPAAAESTPAAPPERIEPEPQPVVVAPPPAARPATEPRVALAVARESRYANTWVNVRAGRSPSAPVLRTLEPGELVAVDTPLQGWYRVVNGGRETGYVDGRFLDTAPPPDSP
ncbi:MAG: SH3 domain-containing protein [Gemmatimonadetes bacterium]|nr:SH3 domain-containing protein [Gemmatimonadota bacterium]